MVFVFIFVLMFYEVWKQRGKKTP